MISKRQPVIVCAACRHCDLIICGARHFDKVMHTQIKFLNIKVNAYGWEQGFIDQFGKFYTLS